MVKVLAARLERFDNVRKRKQGNNLTRDVVLTKKVWERIKK